jgi:anaerobic selenocysteine-containing dehydrogenase
MTTTTYRSCNLCEAICGLAIEHDDREVFSIKGDNQDPLSRGHICPKALALQDIYYDTDRLRTPVQKTANGFEPISWQAAFDLVEKKLRQIRNQHGDDAVALYLGNPTVHNYGAMMFQGFLKSSLQTKNRFAATSVDQLPHHFAASQMFGHGLLIPVPDIDHTEHMLILGANPAASNGSLMTAPGVKGRLKAIRDRGGKVVLIDPRATETAPLVDEHHFVRPGTDAYLLGAILQVIFSQKLTRLERMAAYTKNIDQLSACVASLTPELAEAETGIAADVIRHIAIDFAKADRAVAYGRMGVSTQANGGSCHWLINAINLVTGNLDRRGGQMFATPAVGIVGRQGTAHEFGRWHSRVRGLPEFEGDLPVSVMAEEMLTPGEGQIRAMITNAGNPVLSCPNGRQLDRAIAGLDFFVAMDIYVNETTRHADLILPSPTGLETDHYDLAFNALAVHDVAKHSPPIFDPVAGSRYDWQIMKELALRLTSKPIGLPRRFKQAFRKRVLQWATPQRLLNIALAIGPYGAWRQPFRGGMNLRRLKAAVHGVDLGELKPCFPQALRTSDQKVDAAPAACLQAIDDLRRGIASKEASSDSFSFALIGRRHLRSNNSWMHNSRRLTKGPNRCTLMMHDRDAESLGLSDGDQVIVRSRVGAVQLPLETTDAIMPGVVSIPHGYGHDREGVLLTTARQNAGVSLNDLTDETAVDSLTGNAAFSGQRVSVQKADPVTTGGKQS